jgi:hypothetical protein
MEPLYPLPEGLRRAGGYRRKRKAENGWVNRRWSGDGARRRAGRRWPGMQRPRTGGCHARLGLKTPGYEKKSGPAGRQEVKRGWCPGSVEGDAGGWAGGPARP